MHQAIFEQSNFQQGVPILAARGAGSRGSILFIIFIGCQLVLCFYELFLMSIKLVRCVAP